MLNLLLLQPMVRIEILGSQGSVTDMWGPSVGSDYALDCSTVEELDPFLIQSLPLSVLSPVQ